MFAFDAEVFNLKQEVIAASVSNNMDIKVSQPLLNIQENNSQYEGYWGKKVAYGSYCRKQAVVFELKVVLEDLDSVIKPLSQNSRDAWSL